MNAPTGATGDPVRSGPDVKALLKTRIAVVRRDPEDRALDIQALQAIVALEQRLQAATGMLDDGRHFTQLKASLESAQTGLRLAQAENRALKRHLGKVAALAATEPDVEEEP